jgi:hypothetical protein
VPRNQYDHRGRHDGRKDADRRRSLIRRYRQADHRRAGNWSGTRRPQSWAAPHEQLFRCDMLRLSRVTRGLARATDSTGGGFMRDVISAPAPGLDLRRCRGAACPSRASHPNSATRRHHREGLKVCGLAAGGSRIRTFRPSPDSSSPSWWSGAWKPNGGPEGSFSVPGPLVRIHLPPAKSPRRILLRSRDRTDGSNPLSSCGESCTPSAGTGVGRWPADRRRGIQS